MNPVAGGTMRIQGKKLLALLVVAAPAANAADNRVSDVVVAADGGKATVRIVGSAPAQFTVFKLSDPARVVVDLASTDVTGVLAKAGKGVIEMVTASQFKSPAGEVGRVTVALAEDAKYEVRAEGNDVVLSVGGAAVPAQVAAAPAPEPAAKAEPAARAEPSPAEKSVFIAPVVTPVSDPAVVQRRVDEKEVARAAGKLVGLKAIEGNKLLLETDGEVRKFELIELRGPARLAIDLYGLASPKALAAPPGAPVKGVRLGKYDDRVRVVLDGGAETMGKYTVTRAPRGVLIDLSPAKVAAAPLSVPPAEVSAPLKGVEAPSPRAEPPAPLAAKAAPTPGERVPPPEPAKPAPLDKAAPAAKKAVVSSVDYRSTGADAAVEVGLTTKVEYELLRAERSSVLVLKKATIPERLERTLDVSALAGPLKAVSSYADGDQPDVVKVVAELRGAAADRVEWRDGKLRWIFTGPAEPSAVVGKEAPLSRAAGFVSDAPAYALSSAPQKRYRGKPVDINLKDIELHNLFTYIAEVSKKNLVVADDVKGRVTIRLRNVPWEEALDLILKARGLGKEEIGNVIRIAPAERLRAEQEAAVKAQQSDEELAPLKVRLIPVNYASASDVASKVKDILSKRGSVTTDERTNVLIVKDVAESLAKVEGMVRTLDTQTPQVLIESRIVEASTRFTREVGVQWGGAISMAPVTGNPTGLVFPNAIQIAGATPSGGVVEGISPTPNFVVNMPAPIGLNSGAGVGFTFGSAGGAAQLNLRLSAFENSGTIRTISAPRVTTLDNKEAEISQGIKVPFSQVSAAGTNTTFIEANLELKVNPHVTSDGSILMKISASNNQPNPQLTGANGQPSISKREAKTEVLLKDGDTTVIGGIYTRVNSYADNEVPVLSKIPVLGWLFKKRNEEDNRTELLIFITPRIINRQQSVVAASAVSGG